MKQKVFFFKFPLENSRGGGESYTLWLAKYFRDKGLEVKLFTSDDKLFRMFEKNHLARKRLSVGLEPTSRLSLLLWPITYFAARKKFKRLLLQIAPGSIFFMQSLTEKLILSPLILNSKISHQKSKIFWVEHKIPGRWLKDNPLKSHYLRLSRSVQTITVSNFAKREFVKLGVSEKNIIVVYPTASSPPPIRPLQTDETWVERKGGFTMGILSRLDPEKGVLDFLKIILPELRKRNWFILIAGEGEERQEIESFISNNHLKQQIMLLGLLSDLDKFFSRVSVLIYPTKAQESFGLSALEAITRGVPVVATKIGALPEIVDDNKSGFLVPDPQKWTELLIRIKDPQVYLQMGEEARKKAYRINTDKLPF